jgi:hypothetical protein
MSRIDDHINRLNERLQLLLKRYQALEKENEKLRQDLEQRLLEEKLLQEKVLLLEQESAIVKAASDVEGKNELEKRINSYIREIDQCIALLASQ